MMRLQAQLLPSHGQGMRARDNEEQARVALRTFLLRARTPTPGETP